MTPALPALLIALLAAPDPSPARTPDLVMPAQAATHAPTGGARIRCEGRAAPRLHEETANVSVTRLRTERAARDEAVRACLAALRAVPLAGGTVGDRLTRDPLLAREVEGVVRAARPEDAPRLFADGGVALRLSVPLDGALARLLTGGDAWPSPVPTAPTTPPRSP